MVMIKSWVEAYKHGQAEIAKLKRMQEKLVAIDAQGIFKKHGQDDIKLHKAIQKGITDIDQIQQLLDSLKAVLSEKKPCDCDLNCDW